SCLVRDPAALEALARMRLIAFDKSGTLTSGETRVVAIDTDGATADVVLAHAAGLEGYAEHGWARAGVAAAARRRPGPVASGAGHGRSLASPQGARDTVDRRPSGGRAANCRSSRDRERRYRGGPITRCQARGAGTATTKLWHGRDGR